MAEFTRRNVLAGGLAASAAAAAPFAVPARAAAPPAGKQAAGFYRYKVGDFECTSINDGARTFPMPDGFVRNVPKEQALAAAEAAYMPKGMVTVPFNPQLINTGSKLVLIDTGFGPTPNARGRPAGREHGGGRHRSQGDRHRASSPTCTPITPTASRMPRAVSCFPNAEIKVPAVDWAFWMSDDNMAKAPNDMMKNYFANTRKVYAGLADKVTKYEWGKEVAPGITALDACRPYAGPHRLRGRLRQRRACSCNPTSPTSRSCSCAIRTGTWRSTSIRRRQCRPAASSTTWRRPRRRSIAGFHFTFPSHGLRREGRHRLSAGADRLEPGALSISTSMRGKMP